MGEYSKSKEKFDLTYKFICAFVDKYHYPPSVREICHTVGFKSTASAQYYLDRLEKQGYIRRSAAKNRTIEILKRDNFSETTEFNSNDSISLPFYGNIAAGQPLGSAVVTDVNYNVPSNFFNLKGNNFLLKVKGDSMIEQGIFDGDLVIIQQQNTADEGQIIAAQIDNEDVTLKRFYKGDNFIRLHPENSSMNDIIITNKHQFRILGIIVGLLRKDI